MEQHKQNLVDLWTAKHCKIKKISHLYCSPYPRLQIFRLHQHYEHAQSKNRLLFGVNEKLLTQHISGPVTKYKLLYVSNQGRAGARAWPRVIG